MNYSSVSYIFSSVAYDLQRVRYKHTHVPDGDPPKDDGPGREDTPEEGEI